MAMSALENLAYNTLYIAYQLVLIIHVNGDFLVT